MTDSLSKLINRIKTGIDNKSNFVTCIKYPKILLASLIELKNSIGNSKIKESVASQVNHLILTKRKIRDGVDIKDDDVMLNSVLYGPPGVGKTMIGTKLAKIWYALGFLNDKPSGGGVVPQNDIGQITGTDSTMYYYTIMIFIAILLSALSLMWSFFNKYGGKITLVAVGIFFLFVFGFITFLSAAEYEQHTNFEKFEKSTPENIQDNDLIRVVSRDAFVAKYLGHSDKQTLKVLNENLGRVLFVDEAYSLVTDVHDMYGMEVLTTINLFLSQHPRDIIVIFAGYKDLMNNTIFACQPGLKRRFMWQFECEGYNAEELFEIFQTQLHKKKWKIDPEEIDKVKELFVINKDDFPAFGGDTERLCFLSELAHSEDFIEGNEESNNILNSKQIYNGLSRLKENNMQEKVGEKSTNPLANMMRLMRQNM